MKLRNSSPDTLELRLPELSKLVAPDEVVDIADEIGARYTWPESIWTVVTEPKKTKES